MAIQLAKHAGATVFTKASAGNHQYVRSLGADHGIDYQRESFVEVIKNTSPEGIDLAYIAVGGDVLRNSYRVVKPGGALVTIVEAPDVEEARRLGIRATFVFVEPKGAQLREITRLIEAGIVRPPEIIEMNLEEAPRAHELSQAGHVRGKLMLKIDQHYIRGGRMAAYVLADVTILDPDVYEDYRRQVPAVIEKYGGHYLVRGGASEVFEGDWQPNRLIMLEFPDMNALRRWYRSDDYQALLGIRQSAARANLIAVEGI